MAKKEEVRELTTEQFMQEFRPNGKGSIGIVTNDLIDVIEFDEIVCDVCNDEVPKDSGNKVWIKGSYLYCEKCAEKWCKPKKKTKKT